MTSQTETTVKFAISVKYETKEGENVYILGDSDSFGNWKTNKFKLNWTTGHIWRAVAKINSTQIENIKYKFVVINNNDGSKRWEDGPNRLLSNDPASLKTLKQNKNKEYILDLYFNHFAIEFNIYYPINDHSRMQLVGEPPELANWQREEESPLVMELSEYREMAARDDLVVKGNFWTKTVIMKITEPRNYDFEYRYSIFDTITKTAVWEREPNRHLKIFFDTDCEENRKKLEDNPVENKLLLNSFLRVIDVNFVAGLEFNKMGDLNIYIGPYPQTNEDFDKIRAENITAILNLQTDKDLKHRQVDHKAQFAYCKKIGIDLVRYPIEDFDQDDLANKLEGAGKKLKELIDEGKSVYVHCTAGMSRAAATVIIYMVLYLDYSVAEARDHCKKYRPIICPNYDVIDLVVKRNKPEKALSYAESPSLNNDS